MSDEPEVIRQEMDETRSSLTDKIGQLEQHVVDTVHEASAGVKQTVEAVKETVQSVRDSVGETVDSVKESFSIPGQVERHPWAMMAGTAGLGFLAGYIFMAPSPKTQPAPFRAPRKSGNGMHKSTPAMPSSFADVAPPTAEPEGVLHQLTRTFENEINQIKGLAIGTLAGVVRDLVGSTIPEMMRSPVEEVFNNLTVKLGGQPVRGRIIPEDWHTRESVDDAERKRQASSFRDQRQTTM